MSNNNYKNTRIRTANFNPAALRSRLTKEYETKYFELFMDLFKFEGIGFEAQYSLMRSLWAKGSVSAIMIQGSEFYKDTDDYNSFLFFDDYVISELDAYEFPLKAKPVNKMNAPFIPNRFLTVHKEIVLGYINHTFEPFSAFIRNKIRRIVNVDMVINTNLQLHKMPYALVGDPKDYAKIKDTLNRLLDDEIAVYFTPDEVAMIKSISTNTPYIIDKLYMYKNSLENELTTFIGLDNNMVTKKERAIVDEVNANNAEINANAQRHLKFMEMFFDEIRKVFGIDNISVSLSSPLTESVHEDQQDQEDQEGQQDQEGEKE